MKRRPKLIADDTPEANWRVRLADGSERGPLTATQVRGLLECGAATAKSLIADRAGHEWQPLGTHALWPEISPPPPAPRRATPCR